MKRPKTRAYFFAEDASFVEKKFAEILKSEAELKKYSDPFMALAEQLNIRIPQDLKSTGPLKNLVEGKRISKTSAAVFTEKLGIKFRPDRVPLLGRPKHSCALEDMKKNGAKIGVIPHLALTMKADGSFGFVVERINHFLNENSIQVSAQDFISHRDITGSTIQKYHFLIGAAISDKNSAVSIVKRIAKQTLGVIVDEHAAHDDRRKVGVIAGSPEERMISKWKLNSNRIISLYYNDHVAGYDQLFEAVQSGQLKGGIASCHAISSWMTVRQTPPHLMAKFIQHLLENDKIPKEERKDFSEIAKSFDPSMEKKDRSLVLLRDDEMQLWLKNHLDLKSNIKPAFLEMPIGVALVNGHPAFNFKSLSAFLKRIKFE